MNTTTLLQPSTLSIEEQRDKLALALIRFIDMTGGIDGMSTGSQDDPRFVRLLALGALEDAGMPYSKNTLLAQRGVDQRGTLHPGGIRTPGFVTPAHGAAVPTYIAPNVAREFDDQHDGRRI